MKRNSLQLNLVLLFLLVILNTGCVGQPIAPAGSVPTTPAPTPVPTQIPTNVPVSAPQTFGDPFAYCAAVGTIDSPDGGYTGPAVPEMIINGFKKAANLENSTEPMDIFQKTTIWRCMNQQVYACNFGANLPCNEKANTDKTPTQEMNDFCQANPSADFIPMSVTGHNTVYSWHCEQGKAEVLDQIAQVDAAGYLADIWYPIEPNVPPSFPPTQSPEPTAPPALSTGIIQPLVVEVCNGEAQAMAHYLDVIEVTQSEAPLEDWVTGSKGTGCQATVTGTGVQFKGPDQPLKALESMLKDEGWTEDIQLQAGGPTGIGAGYRKGDQICLISSMWLPDASANCPQDQPISACSVKPEQQNYTINLNCGIESKR